MQAIRTTYHGPTNTRGAKTAGKQRGWHNAWQRLPDGRLRHLSEVEFTADHGDGFILFWSF